MCLKGSNSFLTNFGTVIRGLKALFGTRAGAPRNGENTACLHDDATQIWEEILNVITGDARYQDFTII